MSAPAELSDRQKVLVAEAIARDLIVQNDKWRNRIDAVLAVCDKHEHGALRWADPLPVPEWIAEVREAATKGS